MGAAVKKTKANGEFLVHYKEVYIVEKKFQNRAGSDDEKLQTYDFKKNQYKDVLEYIKESSCYIFYNELPISFLNLPKIS